MRQFVRSLSRRFAADRTGIASVEFALIAPILGLLMLGTVEYGGETLTKNRLSSSIRLSAQYIVQGGGKMSVAEDIFATSFDGPYRSFTAYTSCGCAVSRSALEAAEGDAASLDRQRVTVLDIADLPNCEASCGDDPVLRYLDFEAVTMTIPILESEPRALSQLISMRIQ